MATDIHKGDTVTWKLGNGTGKGVVQSRFTRKTTRKIAGEDISRDGKPDNAALYIKNSGDGHNVLKLESEVRKA